MNIIRKIDYWFSRQMLVLRRHLDYRQGELLGWKLAKRTGVSRENIHFTYPFYISGSKYIQFRGKVFSHPGMRIECIDNYAGHLHHPHLVIGKDVFFNYYCHIGVIDEVTIGDNVLIGSHVLIIDHQHGESMEEQREIPWAERPLASKGPVHIEDNVWLGENVCVMPGVTIGKGSVIGANAVVTHDIPPYSTAVGAPARVINSLNF